jgi:hypothetical protein
MKRLLPLLFALLLAAAPATGQAPSDTLRADTLEAYDSIERVLDDRVSDAQGSEQTAELLTRLANNPLDLNRADASDLSTIPALSPRLARRIVRYRTETGRFDSVGGLKAVKGIDDTRLRALRPYLMVSSADASGSQAAPYPSIPSLGTVASNLNVDVIQRVTRELDLGRGYADDTSRTTFEGSPERLTTRFRLHYDRRFQLALTVDKDPGEPLRWAPQNDTYGFDHVAGNLTLRDWHRLETLIVGDFTAQYGQGVALWQGLTFGKGRDPVSPLVRSGRGLVPFQSTSENRFFRGVAASIAVTPNLSASGFYSRRRRDATLDSTAAGADAPIPARTLSTGGRHRTRSEIERKGAFGKTTVGGALTYSTPRLRVGVTGYRSRFDRPLRPPPDQPYQRFDVSGTQDAMMSVFASAYLDEYTLFGEVARTGAGAYGTLAGAALDHEAGVQAVVMGRHFPRTFHGLYNSAVGESGDTQNEMGLYTGLRLRVAERWRVGVYVDQYRFPWLRFGAPRPTRGIDTRLVVEHDPRPWLSTYVQLRAEREAAGTENPGPEDRLLGAVHAEHRQSARWHMEYAFSDVLTLRTRIQGSRFSASGSTASYGVLVAQGLRFEPVSSLRLDARIAAFDTDGFDSRIYAYEHDLLYSFSVPVLFDRGQRSYVLAQYEPTQRLTLEAKYGVTWYPHRNTIGSGLNQTDGNRSRELRFQVRWQY